MSATRVRRAIAAGAVAAAAAAAVRILRGPPAPVFRDGPAPLPEPPRPTGVLLPAATGLAPGAGAAPVHEAADVPADVPAGQAAGEAAPTPAPAPTGVADTTPAPEREPAPEPEPTRVPGVDLTPTATAWVAPVDGECPPGYPVKAKLRSGIYHRPGMSAYQRTRPDRCYATAEAAEADGLRAAKH